MKRKLMILLLFILPVLVLCGSAEELQFDGYIFRIEDSATGGLLGLCGDDELKMQLAESPEVEEVIPELGIYSAETVEDIYANVPEDKIVYIEPNYYLQLFETAASGWERGYLNTDIAKDYGLTGNGIRIGIIDTGLDADHLALEGAKIIDGENFIGRAESGSTTKNADYSDNHGHGTFIAGILAAQPGKIAGISGIVPEAEIVPLKAFDSTGATQGDVAMAIYAAVDTYECDVINMSFGASIYVSALADSVEYAISKGVVMVAAAGNEAQKNNPTNYPAAYAGVIGVGAYNSSGTICSFSEHNTTVDLSAPGYEITGIKAGGGTRVWNGTSFAAPIISAIAALTVQAQVEDGTPRDSITSNSVLEILKSAAEDMGASGYDTYFGWGTVKVDGLVNSLYGGKAFDGSAAEGEDGHSVFTASGKIEITGNGIYVLAAEYSSQNRLLSLNILYYTDASEGSVLLRKRLLSKGVGSTWKIIKIDSGFAPSGGDTTG